MPVRYVVEMFCDRIAASRTYRKEAYVDRDPWDYYQRSKPHYILHSETRALLEDLLCRLKDEGEEAVFSYIRQEVLPAARQRDGGRKSGTGKKKGEI